MTTALVSALAFVIVFVITAAVLTVLTGRTDTGERAKAPARQPRPTSQREPARPSTRSRGRQPREARKAPGPVCERCGTPATVQEQDRLLCSKCYRSLESGEQSVARPARRNGIIRRGLGRIKVAGWSVAEGAGDRWDRLRWAMERRRRPAADPAVTESAPPEGEDDSPPQTAPQEATEMEPRERAMSTSGAGSGRDDVEAAAGLLREMVQEAGAEVEVMYGQDPAGHPSWQIVLLGTSAELRKAVGYCVSDRGEPRPLSSARREGAGEETP